MNRQNFDANSVSNYPLSIDRMAEMQGDVQVPLKMLAGVRPLGNCILAGCETPGMPGYAIVGSSDGNNGTVYEVYEVKSGSSLGTHLVVAETQVSAENSAGATVVVRVERCLNWSVGVPVSGTYVAYAGLPRLWVKKAAQDDAVHVEVPEGTGWVAASAGHRLRAQYAGGRLHLYGNMVYQPSVGGGGVGGGGVGGGGVVVGGTLTSGTIFRLPQGYRPAGDVPVPIRYNGTPMCAVLASSGQLLTGQDSTQVGDTLKIDTYIEL